MFLNLADLISQHGTVQCANYTLRQAWSLHDKQGDIYILCCRLYIYTRTDQADSRRGFRIKYYTGCNIMINRPNGTIHSPAYGVARYPSNQVGSRIYWHIVKQTDKIIKQLNQCWNIVYSCIQ